jgi:hypothetical protein
VNNQSFYWPACSVVINDLYVGLFCESKVKLLLNHCARRGDDA